MPAGHCRGSIKSKKPYPSFISRSHSPNADVSIFFFRIRLVFVKLPINSSRIEFNVYKHCVRYL